MGWGSGIGLVNRVGLGIGLHNFDKELGFNNCVNRI